MTPTLQNQQQQDWRKWAIILLALIIISILHWSCNPQKQLDRSYQRVIADSVQMAKVRAVVERIWPCVPAVSRPGRVIRVIDKVPDTAQINAYKRKLDSLINASTIKPGVNIDSITAIIRQELEDQFTPVINTIHDTQIDTVPDTRAIELMQERLDAAKQAQFTAEGQITAKDKQIKDVEKQSQNRLAIIIAILSFIVLLLGISVYFKFFTASGGVKSLIKNI